MDNVQNCNSYISTPLSQTYTTYLFNFQLTFDRGLKISAAMFPISELAVLRRRILSWVSLAILAIISVMVVCRL
jgi:hypothetical protein